MPAAAPHHALIVSPCPQWAAQSGLANMLSWLGLSVLETPCLAQAPETPGGYAVVIVQLVAGETTPDSLQRERADLSGAIVLTCDGALPRQLSAGGHLSCPIREASLATALAAAGYALPLPGGRALEQHLSQLVNGDAAVTAELIASLLDTGQADLQHLREVCAAHRWSDVRASAHRIKGAAHLTGATALVALSQRIEALAWQDCDGDTMQALVALYLPAVENLLQALAALAGQQPSSKKP